MGRELVVETTRRFSGGPVIEAALRLGLDPAPIVVLFGPSGSGKTTILRQIAGLERPDEGRVSFDGEVWTDIAADVFLPPQSRRVGLLFQDYALFPHLTVRSNIGFGIRAEARAARDGRVTELLDLLDLRELADRHPAALSGGQKQRVALARTLAPRPRLLMLDEPLSALDTPARESLRHELRTLLRRLGMPAIVVTHDRTEALALGDFAAVLSGGRVRQFGAVADVFSNPADLEVARTVGIETVVEARVGSRERGLVHLLAGTAELTALEPPVDSDSVFVCIRADEVTLEPPGAPHGSARNHLPARITGIVEEGMTVRVILDCGFRLVAFVTRASMRDLDLRLGGEVVAVIKATALRLVER